MQTFMPHTDYDASAFALDNKRLGKQRVEAFQIVKALRGDYDDTGAWVNHPATKMWSGHIVELCRYGAEMCYEWTRRGFDDSLRPQFLKLFRDFIAREHSVMSPWWVNDELLHMSHRSNLMRKAPDFYLFDVPRDMPYVWPLMDERAYRLGTYRNGDNLTMLKNGVVYLTSSQVAEILGVSPKTISSYKARGQMPAPDRQYGRTPLWRYDTIEKWRGELRTPIRTTHE